MHFVTHECGLQVWPALVAGASLHVVPDVVRSDLNLLHAFLRDRSITLALLPTPVAELILAENHAAFLPRLRVMWTGGDRLLRVPSL